MSERKTVKYSNCRNDGVLQNLSGFSNGKDFDANFFLSEIEQGSNDCTIQSSLNFSEPRMKKHPRKHFYKKRNLESVFEYVYCINSTNQTIDDVFETTCKNHSNSFTETQDIASLQTTLLGDTSTKMSNTSRDNSNSEQR